jgi:hypothetical protein
MAVSHNSSADGTQERWPCTETFWPFHFPRGCCLWRDCRKAEFVFTRCDLRLAKQWVSIFQEFSRLLALVTIPFPALLLA